MAGREPRTPALQPSNLWDGQPAHSFQGSSGIREDSVGPNALLSQRGAKPDEHALCRFSLFDHGPRHHPISARNTGSRQRGRRVGRSTHYRRPTSLRACQPDHGHDRRPDGPPTRSRCQREPRRLDTETADSGRAAVTAGRPAHTESAGDCAESVVGQAASGSLRYSRWRRCGCRYRSCDSRGRGSFRRVLRWRRCGRRGRVGREPIGGDAEGADSSTLGDYTGIIRKSVGRALDRRHNTSHQDPISRRLSAAFS